MWIWRSSVLGFILQAQTTVTETIVIFHPNNWKKWKSCSASMGSSDPLHCTAAIISPNPEISLLQEKHVRQMSTLLHCPVRQKRSKAFLGYYTVLHCVLHLMVVRCVPSFSVFSQRLSAVNFIQLCWITGTLRSQTQSEKEKWTVALFQSKLLEWCNEIGENLCLDWLENVSQINRGNEEGKESADFGQLSHPVI